MQRQKALMVSVVILCLAAPLACGPKCPDVKSAMPQEEIAQDDGTRLNEFVDRRKALVQGGEEGADRFVLDRMKFSVTAYELAIQIQARIINLAGGSALYEKNITTINNTRCFLDTVIKGSPTTISDRVGKDIHTKHALFKKLFSGNGKPSKYELKDILENGVVVEEPKKSEDDDDAFGDDEEEEEAAEGDETDEAEENDDDDDEDDDLGLFD